jgi:hypothetical protein
MNHLAVLVVVVLQQVLGFAWYSQARFSKPWYKGVKKQHDVADKKGKSPFIAAFVGALLQAYVLAWVIELSGARTLMHALQLGVLLWLGFAGQAIAVHQKFLGYPWSVIAIDAGKELAGALLAAVVLVMWR